MDIFWFGMGLMAGIMIGKPWLGIILGTILGLTMKEDDKKK